MTSSLRIMRCAECRAELPAQTLGRPRRYCSSSCKSRAKRRRAAMAVPWPPAAPEDYPVDRHAVNRRTAAGLIAAMEGAPAAPPEDQLAQALLEVGWLAYTLESLERSLPMALAGPAGELGRRIRSAREVLFPNLVGALA